MNPTIERIFPSGGWLVYAVIGGHLVRERYFDYSREEALEIFRHEHATEQP